MNDLSGDGLLPRLPGLKSLKYLRLYNLAFLNPSAQWGAREPAIIRIHEQLEPASVVPALTLLGIGGRCVRNNRSGRDLDIASLDVNDPLLQELIHVALVLDVLKLFRRCGELAVLCVAERIWIDRNRVSGQLELDVLAALDSDASNSLSGR